MIRSTELSALTLPSIFLVFERGLWESAPPTLFTTKTSVE